MLMVSPLSTENGRTRSRTQPCLLLEPGPAPVPLIDTFQISVFSKATKTTVLTLVLLLLIASASVLASLCTARCVALICVGRIHRDKYEVSSDVMLSIHRSLMNEIQWQTF
jgi:hypothetical protein